ncbi:MAG: hypothetical protein BWX51_00371 [Bacteroidetes bacterium ADurb.Bin012]|jgi:hypothetical protein|nr:MAG: hypothetical protein BWX51_00371 [Bacteroidetes bacterium ADurb.Bin012]
MEIRGLGDGETRELRDEGTKRRGQLVDGG